MTVTQQSPSAWVLTRELITAGNQPADIRFVGMYVLYKKIISDYKSLKDSDKRELVEFLREIIKSLSISNELRILVSITSRAYSVLGILQPANRLEPTVLTEIVEMSRPGHAVTEQAVTLLLHLQNAFAEELATIHLERAVLSRVLELVSSHKKVIAGFWTEILKLPQTPQSQQLIELVLTTISSFTSRRVQFLTQPQLIMAMLNLYLTDEWFETITGILVQLAECSNYSRARNESGYCIQEIIKVQNFLEQGQAGMQNNYAELEGKDFEDEILSVHSVSLILEFLLQHLLPKVETELNKRQSIISKCTAEVLVALLKCFPELTFLINKPYIPKLYRGGVLLMMHVNNSISCYSLDIWIGIKRFLVAESLSGDELPVDMKEFFLNVFDEVFLRLLDRIRINNNKEFELLTSEWKTNKLVDLDEDDDVFDGSNKFKNMSLKDYRSTAEDIFYG